MEHIIGFKPGTIGFKPGTGGVSYLVKVLELKFFPDLFSVRTSL
ncbi:hypothetical protein [Azospirillum sp. B4]|nr:hypothetical protein [Azospirillum sp. B4]